MLGVFGVGFEPEDDNDDADGWDELPEKVTLQLDVLPVMLDDVMRLVLVWQVISSLHFQ